MTVPSDSFNNSSTTTNSVVIKDNQPNNTNFSENSSSIKGLSNSQLQQRNSSGIWAADGDSSIAESDSDSDENITNCELSEKCNSDRADKISEFNDASVDDSIVSKQNIGSIAIQSSADITFGNKTFYRGPVTIKQFLLDDNDWTENGNDKPANLHSNGDGVADISIAANVGIDKSFINHIYNGIKCEDFHQIFFLTLIF